MKTCTQNKMRQWWTRHALYLLESAIKSLGVLSCRYDLLRVEWGGGKDPERISQSCSNHYDSALWSSNRDSFFTETETRLFRIPTYTRQTTKHNEATFFSLLEFLRPSPHPCLLLAPAAIAATTSDITALSPTFSSKRNVSDKKRVSRVVTNFSERAGLKLETVL